MKYILSFIVLFKLKLFTHLLYKVKIQYLNSSEKEIFNNQLKAIIFFNHTSLYEILFIGAIPFFFLWKFTTRMVAPGADKTLNRPLVGKFWKLAFPQMTSISRKRDHTWDEFKSQIQGFSIVTIAAEGRMKRENGLDLDGNKMSVKSGNIDIIEMLGKGNMVFAYSGGLHHVQFPGQTIPKILKIIKMNIEVVDIENYKKQFTHNGELDRKGMLCDLQKRLETKCP